MALVGVLWKKIESWQLCINSKMEKVLKFFISIFMLLKLS